MWIVEIPGVTLRVEQLLYIHRDWAAFFFHARDRCFHAYRVPKLEWAHLPVEAKFHGTIDFDHSVRNLRDTVGGVGPEIGKGGPQELPGLVALLWAAAVHA